MFYKLTLSHNKTISIKWLVWLKHDYKMQIHHPIIPHHATIYISTKWHYHIHKGLQPHRVSTEWPLPFFSETLFPYKISLYKDPRFPHSVVQISTGILEEVYETTLCKFPVSIYRETSNSKNQKPHQREKQSRVWPYPSVVIPQSTQKTLPIRKWLGNHVHRSIANYRQRIYPAKTASVDSSSIWMKIRCQTLPTLSPSPPHLVHP